MNNAKVISNPEIETLSLKSDSKDHELKVKRTYENKGFNVIKTPRGHRTLNKNLEPIKTITDDSENKTSEIFCTGVPDLLVWDNERYFFVECKNVSNLAPSQLQWLDENSDLPVKIVYVQGWGEAE
jgi:hypothetical protein